jgi:nucleoside-diphosphate-sugar epimerase
MTHNAVPPGPATAPPPQTALIMGITGAIGRATARALARRGYCIRALARDPTAAAARVTEAFPIEWRRGDALDKGSVIAAAQDASILFHGVNPPGYTRWREDGLPMLANSIAAAKVSGARIFFPGNVYVFGPDAGDTVDETAPHHPTTRKGAVRVEMETMLEAAARDGVRSVILRAGDFFGPGVESSWFAQAVAKGGTKAKVLYDLTTVGHTWAYIPDLAETFAAIADRQAALRDFEVFHFDGHWIETGAAMASAAKHAIGRPDLKVKRFPWIILYLSAPFVTFMREALEMMWLWKRPLRLNGQKLRAFLGETPHTPFEIAIRDAVRD